MTITRKHATRSMIAGGGILFALPLLAACSASVSPEDVEEQITTVLTEQVGQAPDSVTCPEGLPAEMDAEIRCELEAGGETIGVTVTVTSVEGGDVGFDVVVDDAPSG